MTRDDALEIIKIRDDIESLEQLVGLKDKNDITFYCMKNGEKYYIDDLAAHTCDFSRELATLFS
jgi:hypothetical protein